jgi:hypothetical protein
MTVTDGPDGRPGPPGPRDRPDVAALAETDAGLPDAVRAARARAAASEDCDARAVRDALAATRADLAALPTPAVPEAVARRWAAALAAEAEGASQRAPAGEERTEPGSRPPAAEARASGPSPRGVPTRSAARPTAPRGRAVGRAVLAAAALTAVVGVGLGGLADRAAPVPTVTRVELVALGRDAVGTMDVGDLADPARRTACLGTVAPAALGETLLGGRRVVVDGRPGVLLVLATGTRGSLRVLTVDRSCGADGGTLIAQLVVGE